jgi:site-specific DNA recombinase
MNHSKGKSKGESKRIRCAIYTRKSTEEGLQQEFNSLDAQRESGEAYSPSHGVASHGPQSFHPHFAKSI